MNHRASVERIMRDVAALFGITFEQLAGECRMRRYAWPRQAAMWVARERLGLSYPDLGRLFLRDHATIIHGCRCVEDRMSTGHAPTIAAVHVMMGATTEAQCPEVRGAARVWELLPA